MIADFDRKVQAEVEKKLMEKKDELFSRDELANHPIATMNITRISVIAGAVALEILDKESE